MARPRLKIDPAQVERLAAIHCTNEEIAAVVGCSSDTIERRYAVNIKTGRARGRASLRRIQWEAAQKGNIGMMIWLGKQLLGQTEKIEQRQEITGKDGGSIVYAVEFGEPAPPKSNP
jgi:hypothetical protein